MPSYPKFHNDIGVPIVRVGCRELKCIGAKPPRHHPHIYLNMGHLNVTEASRRYSPAQVIAVARDVISGVPSEISTIYVERQNLTLRMASKRFARLSNGFSKRLECHLVAVALHVAFYNLCRAHESLRSTPAMALGIADRVWTIGDLLDAALATQPITPTTTAAVSHEPASVESI